MLFSRLLCGGECTSAAIVTTVMCLRTAMSLFEDMPEGNWEITFYVLRRRYDRSSYARSRGDR